MNARVRAPGDGNLHALEPQNQAEGAFNLCLDGPQARLTRPTGKTTALVLEDDARLQTSSSSTISVESDRRGPSFKIREYPPARSEYRGAISSNSL